MSTDKRHQDPESPSKLDVEKPPNTTTTATATRIPLAISLALAAFCVALDNTIVSTAIPKITDEFHALGAAGWYASAYLLTNCTVQLVFGKLYSFLPIKWTFLTALAIFEVGSVLCGAAPNATALIVGRAVSGIGAGGLFSGSLIIVAITVPLEARSVYLGSFSSMFGLASIVGPILGGAFTDKVTWRMCFYINLPLGFLTFVGAMLFFRVRASRRKEQTMVEMLKKLDLPGIVLFIPAVMCLLVALQWGGTYPWFSGRIIALLVVSGVLVIAFIVEQILIGEHALIPHRLLTTTRTMPFALTFAFCLGATFFIFVYFLPTWFQVIKDVSAVDSGVHTLAFLLAQVVVTIIAGVGVKRIGHYAAFMWLSLVFACAGSGLITTRYSVDTPAREWIGFQILYGVGIGFGIQQAVLAVQTVVPQELVAMGSALVMFCQLLGGSIFVSAAESVFDSKILAKLAASDVPGIDAAAVVAAGTTELRTHVPMQYLTTVLADYNECLMQAFRIGMVMACVMTVGVVGVEWRSVKVYLICIGNFNGLYEGLVTKEIRALRKEHGLDADKPWDIWRDGCEGESPQQVTKRLDSLIEEIHAFQAGNMHGEKACDVVLVAHGHLLRAFVKRWLKYPMDFPLSMMLEPGGVGVLSYQHHNIDELAVLVGYGFPVQQ